MTISAEGATGGVFLAIADGGSASISALNEARFRYDPGASQLQYSENNGPWTPLSSLANWWSRAGTNVYPTTVTDTVSIGVAAVAGSEQFRVVGGSLFEVPDNTAQAMRVVEGTNVYLDLNTTNGSEQLLLGSTTVAALQTVVLGASVDLGAPSFPADVTVTIVDNQPAFVVKEGANEYINVDTSNGAELMVLGNATVPNLITALLGNQVSLGSGANPARVGIDIPDNDASALNLNGGGQSYLDIDTTTGSESMIFGNTTDNPSYTFEGTGTVSLAGSGQKLSLALSGSIELNERTTDPTTAVNNGALYTKEVLGVTQLFYREDNNGPVYQLTPVTTSPWNESSSVVSTNNTAWDVVAGAAAMSGVNSEKLRVVGDTSLSGGIYFETTDLGVTGFHDIEVNACTIAGTPGDGLRVTGATTAAATGAVLGGTGGYIRMRGGVGGTQNGTNNGGGGGQMQLYGGVGGNYIGTGTERGGGGGQAVFKAGDGGECTVSTTGDAGPGGITTVAGGDGGRSLAGNTGNCGDGGRLQLWGGSSGNDNGLDGIPGDGGDVWLQGGVGLTNGDGGDVQIRGGESFGGTHGGVRIGDLYTSGIQIGNATDDPETTFLGTGDVTFNGPQKLVEQSSDPATTSNEGALYTKNDGTQTELFFRSEGSGAIYQLTPPQGGTADAIDSATTFTCPAGVSVREVVAITSANTVDKADADDATKRPAYGIVVSKPTSTSCIVRLLGELTGFSGLTPGATYYVSTTPGAIVTPAPSGSGVLRQVVGDAISSTVLCVDIERGAALLAS